MANTIDDLRSHLFETLAALKDKDQPMELDRARAVADVAKVIVESAKVEVDFLKVTGAVKSTGFMPEADTAGGLVVRRQIGKVADPGAAGAGRRSLRPLRYPVDDRVSDRPRPLRKLQRST